MQLHSVTEVAHHSALRVSASASDKCVGWYQRGLCLEEECTGGLERSYKDQFPSPSAPLKMIGKGFYRK